MKILRLILLSLLASLVAGLIIGTIIRLRLEREPVRYFVGQTDSERPASGNFSEVSWLRSADPILGSRS